MEIIGKTVDYVKDTLYKDSSGHDWWHVYRVWKTAKTIGANYGTCDMLVVELSALLHDIADWKSNGGNFDIGPRVAKEWLVNFDSVNSDQIEHVCYIIKNISFKGAVAEKPVLSIEGQIVQDADRLDALGAMGIARTFAYGGHKGQPIYDPNLPPLEHGSEASYVHNKTVSTSINHFYEKLLLLKNLLNTDHGRNLAENRHKFMEQYLEQFYEEWEGVR